MSTSKRRGWLLLGGGVAALLIIFAVMGKHVSVGYTSRLSCCLKDGTTGGGLAIARWAERLSFRVRALDEPLWESVKKLEQPAGNCVITAGDHAWSPWREDMTDDEWAAVRGWVRRGNALILMTTMPDDLPEPVKHDLLAKPMTVTSSRAKLPAMLRWFEPSVEVEPATSTASMPDGGHLVVKADGDRLAQAPGDWRVASDSRGSVFHRIAIGDGAVYLLTDGFAWTNAGFDRPENVKALAALIRREVRGGVLGFDEFRHGHGRVESLGTLLVAVPGAKTFLWVGVLLGGLYLYGANLRFGPPEPHERPERRTAREYIEATAYLHQRARAATLAVAAVDRRFRHLALERGHVTHEAEQILQESELYVASDDRPAEAYNACELVRALVRLRKRLYGG